MHTSPQRTRVPAFQQDYKSSLRARRKTLDSLNDPNYVQDSKLVQNSKILQLAYLDKIIEECDEDQDANNLKDLGTNFASFMAS